MYTKSTKTNSRNVSRNSLCIKFTSVREKKERESKRERKRDCAHRPFLKAKMK